MGIEPDYESDFDIKDPPPMLKTWLSAVTKPTVENFRSIAAHEMANLNTASQWYLIALIIAAFLNLILGFIITTLGIDDWSVVGYAIALARKNIFVAGGTGILFIGIQACMIPIEILITTIVLMFENWLADKVGGDGSFESFVYLCIAWKAPLVILLPFFYQIPTISPYAIAVNYLLQAFYTVKTLLAIKQLSVKKSLFVALSPAIFLLGIGIIQGIFYGIVYPAS